MSVASAVNQARQEADATRKEVEAISATHLKALLSDPSLFLAEHLDDPDLTMADRARLLNTLQARRKTSKPLRPRRTWPSWPGRRTRHITYGSLLFAFLIGLPLRNTTEFAVVMARYSVQRTLPDGRIQTLALQPGDTLQVRRWLRWTPVAVWWNEDTNTYVTAAIPWRGVNFSKFPYLDIYK